MRYQDMPEDQRALTFPTSFLIKAIGLAEYNIHSVLMSVLDRYQVQYEVDGMTVQASKHGKYASVSVWITAESRKQLDDIYEGLQFRPEIVMTI